ncbi:MAG: ribonuclease HI [Alphaproteobacteria bacterium]|jgi:ribonuclease HI|nr:ribonuclease HI [Alphaproteobacteria bacterium]
MKNNNMKFVEIYTDGGCSHNPGEGGIGVLMRYKDTEKTLNGYVPLTTNNQMELLAVIVALDSLKFSCQIKLYTDSKYLQDGITKWIHNWKKNNWKSAAKKPIKNQALWQKLDELVQNHNIEFLWVKGHAGNEGNEIVDALAQKAIAEKSPILNNYLHLIHQDV